MRVSVVAVSAVAALVIVYGVKWYAAARLSSIRLEPLAPAQTAQSADARRIDAGLSSREHQQRVLHVSGSTGFEPLSSFMLRTQQFVVGALWRTAHHSLCRNVHASPGYEFANARTEAARSTRRCGRCCSTAGHASRPRSTAVPVHP